MTRADRIEIFYRNYWPLIRDVCVGDTMGILTDKGFFDAPASTKYHGSYEGGLCDHSYNVTNSLVYLTDQLNLPFFHTLDKHHLIIHQSIRMQTKDFLHFSCLIAESFCEFFI